ncbi:PHP domain-like protein [Cristinia sonorae]|uniref:PHP domain-like protein n=1 Tax=Cristinia sonorae TaxID=1940300 RepID=A0A8K0UDV1_9AGAR|nr:PHP domain-like protein [Cristinia sonorae]
MYIDLNLPVPLTSTQRPPQQSKKGKGKQADASTSPITYTPGQLVELEARIDFLVHLGYTVIAFNQTVQKKVDPKTHANVLASLLLHLRKRESIAYVKRLTIVLDEDSEKGFGLTPANASLFAPYDIIALLPTTAASFSLACLSHSTPSNVTAHIISLPLTLPRLPFNLKHTLVRTALKNGAVFEISYSGALGGESDPSLGSSASGESGSGGKRNWWAAAREIIRVTKGKSVIVTSGAVNQTSLRAPKDVGNLISMLDLPQNLSHDALTKTPQAVILRAQTRRTYRAILSEPRIVIPEAYLAKTTAASAPATEVQPSEETMLLKPSETEPSPSTAEEQTGNELPSAAKLSNGKKRPREDPTPLSQASTSVKAEESSKKKRKKDKSAGAKNS